MPERRLRAELKSKGQRALTHLPDGLLYLGSQKPIAIELELSLKAADRLRDIVTDYAVDRRFHEVWYVVTNQAVRRAVERTIKPYSGFKILNWERAA